MVSSTKRAARPGENMETVEQLHRRQEEVERDSIQSGRERFLRRLNKAKQSGRGSDEGALMVWLIQNVEPLKQGFEAVLNRQGKGRRPLLHTFLEDLGSETVAVVSLMVTANACLTRSPKDSIGKEIVNRLVAERRAVLLKREAPGLWNYKEQSFKGNADFWFKAKSLYASLKWSDVDHEALEFSQTQVMTLSTQILQVVQGVLEGSVLKESKVWKGKRSTYYWSFTEAFSQEITAKDAEFALMSKPINRPTLVPPRDWSEGEPGGYWYGLRGDVTLVRGMRKWQREALKDRDLTVLYQSLNGLQSTPWRVNKRVLEVANHLKARGGGVAGLPATEQAEHPKWPAVVPFPSRGPHAKLTQNERNLIDTAENAEEIRQAMGQYKQARNAWHEAEQERASVAKSLFNQLDVAWDYEAEERFYFVHSVDWRGRVYPASEYLHPQADDVARGILEFAEGETLGEHGAYWLAVKGATSWDGDEKLSKQSFDRRVQWVENNAHQIVAIALDPYGNKAWQDADEPFQFLAFAFEWADYLNCEDPESFVSHLPVPMDGSANAYQWYAGMWRDERGADHVNLIDAETPSDVYGVVADEALDRMTSLFASGDELAGLWLSSNLLDRKLAKVPCMTAVYGSRKTQWPETLDRGLRKSLSKAEYEAVKDHFGERWYEARVLVSNVLHDTMVEVMPAAMRGRDYLRQTARALAAENKTIAWTAPVTNFPVRQASFVPQLKQVNTLLNGTQCYRQAYRVATAKLDKHSQQDGICANFVHSHDAAHLSATVAALTVEHGISSVMTVHDSFAVHACNVPIMRQVLAEQFVRVLSHPILEDLRAAAVEGIEDVDSLPEEEPTGNYDLGQMYAARYLFS